MKILITGGAGFIASNLCEYFVNKGYNVTCLDNFSTGHLHNLNAVIKNSRFKLIEGDVRILSDCKKKQFSMLITFCMKQLWVLYLVLLMAKLLLMVLMFQDS